LSTPEQPWVPGPGDLPWTTHLVNLATSDRHMAFNDTEGRFYRLWQHRPPQPLHAGDAILLRPVDIDQIVKVAGMWIKAHPDDPRGFELTDEVAAGAKAVVLHFAGIKPLG
jgi:hypothetical protein